MTIAIFVKAHRRPEFMERCVASVVDFCDIPFRFYISDDSPPNEMPATLYDTLSAAGHFVARHETRTALTVAKNFLLSEMRDETHVLQMADDFLFGEKTSIRKMVEVLAENSSLGAVASSEIELRDGKQVHGEISSKQGFFLRFGDELIRLNVPLERLLWRRTAAGIRFNYFDFTRSLLLIRPEVFKRVRWREELFVQGEHSAFMLDLQQAGFSLAQTPDSVFFHDERFKKNKEYMKSRLAQADTEAMRKFYRSEYGFKKIDSMNLGTSKRRLFAYALIKKVLSKIYGFLTIGKRSKLREAGW